MSPNNKQSNSKNQNLEDEIQNTNLNQYVHNMQQFSSDEDEDPRLNNGYVLLNQQQDLNDSESESSSEENEANDFEANDHEINNCEINNINQSIDEQDQLNDDEFLNNSQSRSYLTNQPHLENTSFEREYDKKDLDDVKSSICLDKDNIDEIKECMKKINLPSIPSWANIDNNKVFDQKLTNFIYKRLEQANK